jgi:hypothetical protein
VTSEAEKRKLLGSSERMAERIAEEIRSINYDLKRLPKDREQEFSVKLNEQKTALQRL